MSLIHVKHIYVYMLLQATVVTALHQIFSTALPFILGITFVLYVHAYIIEPGPFYNAGLLSLLCE